MRLNSMVLLTWTLVACGDPAGGGEVPVGGGFPGAVGDAGAGAAGCPTLNVTQACQCGASPGSQSCLASGWGPCQCEGDGFGGAMPNDPGMGGAGAGTAVPAGNLRSDITFSWQRTPPSEGSCEPGNYVGTFEGVYFSSALLGLAPLPVASSGTPTRPGLAFTLEETGSGERLEITDGWMEGTANSIFPFEATISGTLDCTTLQFDAVMDGGYWTEPAMTSARVNFIGPIVGVYDKATRTINMGTWNLDEHDPPPPVPSGGNGTWQAGWQP